MFLIEESPLHKNQKDPTIVIQLISGASAGGLAKTFIAPLDR